MTRRTTRPSLFPYTTLFRSENRRHARVKAPEEAGLHSPADLVCAGAEPALVGTDDGHADDPRPGLGDRKSTRLNSSHVAISYAVFCLKKKKRTSRRNIQERM